MLPHCHKQTAAQLCLQPKSTVKRQATNLSATADEHAIKQIIEGFVVLRGLQSELRGERERRKKSARDTAWWSLIGSQKEGDQKAGSTQMLWLVDT